MAVLVPLGCRDGKASLGQRFDAVPSVSSGAPAADAGRPHFSTEPLDRLLQSVLQRVTKSPSVLTVELTRARAVIQLETPTKPGDVVQYEWSGDALHGPIPVELRGAGTLESNLFPLSAVALDEVPDLAESALARIDREHGTVSRILIRRNLPVDEGVGIRVYVDSPIRSGHVDADARGRIVELSRLR